MKTKTEALKAIHEAAAVLCEAVNEAQKDLGIFFDVCFGTIEQIGERFPLTVVERIREAKYPVGISMPSEYEKMPYCCLNCMRRRKDICLVRIAGKYPPIDFVCNQHEDVIIMDNGIKDCKDCPEQ